MKYLMKLAFANIFREKRRTILTVIILMFGMGMLVFFTGLERGMQAKQIENLIEFDTGHFKIRSAKFDEEYPYSVSNFVAQPESIEDKLRKLSFVRGVTARVSFQAEVDNGYDSGPVVAVGVDPAHDSQVFSLTNFFTEGSLQDGGTVLGATLAKDMGVNVGDYVYLTFRNAQGTLDSLELEVTGIINAADPQVNNSTAYITLAEARQGLNTGAVTEICVKTDDYKKWPEYQKKLQKLLPSMQVWSWRRLGDYFIKFAKMDAASGFVFIFFIAIIALVGIINTMLLSVYEKQREIGTLKALGMTDGEVRGLFVLEGFWIGVFGAVTGLIFGALINLYFVNVGFDISAMTGSDSVNIGYKVMGIVHAGWDVPAIITGMLLCVGVSCLASLYPANKTTKMEPVEALRTV